MSRGCRSLLQRVAVRVRDHRASNPGGGLRFVVLAVLITFTIRAGDLDEAGLKTPHATPAAGAVPRTVDFTRDIQPIFAARCYRCHGPDKQKNDLRLDSKTMALRGGSSGPAIVKGQSGNSRLFQYVSGMPEDKLMPPTGKALSAEQIELLRAWIDQGAIWPDGFEPRDLVDRREHWAFQPIVRPPLPQVRQAEWVRNPIDRFILAQLEREQLAPSPEAPRRLLLRRLYFTLTGLPPPPGARDASGEREPLAYEAVVDRLLCSPRYGECWARHWLDVVRFAESNGFETNTERPNSWPYRDYVIRAFN